MCGEKVMGRVQREDGAWRDARIPACLADIVRALNVQHIAVTGAVCGRIVLRDGRVLVIGRGDDAPQMVEGPQ